MENEIRRVVVDIECPKDLPYNTLPTGESLHCHLISALPISPVQPQPEVPSALPAEPYTVEHVAEMESSLHDLMAKDADQLDLFQYEGLVHDIDDAADSIAEAFDAGKTALAVRSILNYNAQMIQFGSIMQKKRLYHNCPECNKDGERSVTYPDGTKVTYI